MELCACCGEALGMESARFVEQMGGHCTACRMAPPEFERAVAYGVYEDELRELIHLLKYERMRGLARPLGAKLAEAVLRLEGEAQELLVVSVPLFAMRERQRGYNQSAMLADAALEWLKRRRPEWKLRAAHGTMRRTRDTESQFALLPRQRRKNLRGAFEVVGDVAGREVLLVDDILTTGATALECARVLRRAGAKKVFVVTLARAQRVERAVMWDGKLGEHQSFVEAG